MPRFSLKTLLASVTFLAMAMAAVTTIIRFAGTTSGGKATLLVAALFAFGPLCGAAVGALYGRIGSGAAWGFMIQMGLLILGTMFFVTS